MAITLSDDEDSNHKSNSDQESKFMAFIATAVVDEFVVIDESPSDEELSENTDLQ